MLRSLAAAALVLGCTPLHTQKLTAEEHRQEAVTLETKAEGERQQYDPAAVQRPPVQQVNPVGTELPEPPPSTYNPTEAHLAIADAEMREAATHVMSADRIEAFEDFSCRTIPAAQRAACPLLASQVSQVTTTRRGVSLRLKPGTDTAATNRMLNCHLAFAYAHGFEHPSCPLFVKGMSISRSGPMRLELTGDSREAVQLIQNASRRIFFGEANAIGSR